MTDYFEERVVSLLGAAIWDGVPVDLKAVPSRVTKQTGILVAISPITACESHLFGFEHAAAVLDINGESQSITVWYDEDRVTSSILAHELIHLRRDVLERVPKLMPHECNPSDETFIYMIEAELEHLFIIPEEIKRFDDAEGRWAEIYSKIIDTIVSREEPDVIEIALTWMQLRNSLPNLEQLAKRLAVHIRAQPESWLKTIEFFRGEAQVSLPDKIRLIVFMSKEIAAMSSRINRGLGMGVWGMHGDQLLFHMKAIEGRRL